MTAEIEWIGFYQWWASSLVNQYKQFGSETIYTQAAREKRLANKIRKKETAHSIIVDCFLSEAQWPAVNFAFTVSFWTEHVLSITAFNVSSELCPVVLTSSLQALQARFLKTVPLRVIHQIVSHFFITSSWFLSKSSLSWLSFECPNETHYAHKYLTTVGAKGSFVIYVDTTFLKSFPS